VSILSNLAWLLLLLGFPDEASRKSADAVATARELAHPVSLAVALHRSCQFHQLLCDLHTVRAEQAELRTLADRHMLPFFLAFAEAFDGLNLAEDKRWAEAIERNRRAVEIFRTNGIVLLNPYLCTLLAQILGRAGRLREASATLKRALRQVDSTKERWFQAEMERTSAELLLAGHDPAAAERCFCQAIGIAQQQSSKFWELRAAISLARLWREQGKRDAARDLLAPTYGWFTEGFDTPVLKEAKALLDELAS
jgi:predicted ATPase